MCDSPSVVKFAITPAIDLVFCVSVIKVDADGYSFKSGTLYFEVIM